MGVDCQQRAGRNGSRVDDGGARAPVGVDVQALIGAPHRSGVVDQDRAAGIVRPDIHAQSIAGWAAAATLGLDIAGVDDGDRGVRRCRESKDAVRV